MHATRAPFSFSLPVMAQHRDHWQSLHVLSRTSETSPPFLSLTHDLWQGPFRPGCVFSHRAIPVTKLNASSNNLPPLLSGSSLPERWDRWTRCWLRDEATGPGPIVLQWQHMFRPVQLPSSRDAGPQPAESFHFSIYILSDYKLYDTLNLNMQLGVPIFQSVF